MSLTPDRPADARDIPGLNPEAEQLAISFAVQACPCFTLSPHKNSYRRLTGALSICTQCGKPQHQHWLRQALTQLRAKETPNGR